MSHNLVHWSHLPVALWNDQPFDSVAVYTGSATIVNGSVAIIYPGVCDGARAGTNPGPVVWPTCSADGAHHYNLVLARPADPDDPLLTNWSKRLIANNTQRVSAAHGCLSHRAWWSSDADRCCCQHAGPVWGVAHLRWRVAIPDLGPGNLRFARLRRVAAAWSAGGPAGWRLPQPLPAAGCGGWGWPATCRGAHTRPQDLV